MADLLEFDCPRCQTRAAASYYGPCDDCRTELRATIVGVVAEVEIAEYEPKMNVTPNAVATKE